MPHTRRTASTYVNVMPALRAAWRQSILRYYLAAATALAVLAGAGPADLPRRPRVGRVATLLLSSVFAQALV